MRLTHKIIVAIEAGPGDPAMPWQRGGVRPVLPVNAATGQAYRGVNILSLRVTALQRGYDSGEFATLKQWNGKGATLRKGEKASPIVFYREIDESDDTTGADDETQDRRTSMISELSIEDISLGRVFADRRFWKLAPISATAIGTAWSLQSHWAAPWLGTVERLDQAAVVNVLFAVAMALSLASLAFGAIAGRLQVARPRELNMNVATKPLR
jgi:N-terminal domain of anti-restriction factor ArdC